MNRTEMRRCGTRYATELDARCSKRGLAPGAVTEECWVPGCGGWHVRFPAERSPMPQGRDTGPDAKTRALVYQRDCFACVCCGTSILDRAHSLGHRLRRSQGGTNCPAGLITLLGLGDGSLGKDDHHYRIDNRDDPGDEAKGYTVRSRKDPHLVSVMVFGPGGGGATLFPSCDGQWSSAPGQVSA